MSVQIDPRLALIDVGWTCSVPIDIVAVVLIRDVRVEFEKVANEVYLLVRASRLGLTMDLSRLGRICMGLGNW